MVAIIIIVVIICASMPICIICLTVALCCTCRKYRKSRKQAAEENVNVTSPQPTAAANAATNSLALEQTEHLYDYIPEVPVVENKTAGGHGSEMLVQDNLAYMDSSGLEVTVESNTAYNYRQPVPTENIAYNEHRQLPPMEGQESGEYNYIIDD